MTMSSQEIPLSAWSLLLFYKKESFDNLSLELQSLLANKNKMIKGRSFYPELERKKKLLCLGTTRPK